MDNLTVELHAFDTPPSEDQPAHDYGAEKLSGEEDVEGGRQLEHLVGTIRPALEARNAFRAESAKIDRDPDLNPEGKRRRRAEARQKYHDTVADFVKQYRSAEAAFLEAYPAPRPEAYMTQTEAATLQAYGPVLRDLLPQHFAEVLRGAIERRERGLLGALIPVGETYLAVRKPYQSGEAYGLVAGLVREGRKAMATPGTYRHQYAEEVVASLRGCVRLFANEVLKNGDIDDLYFEPTSEGRTALHGFTSRLDK